MKDTEEAIHLESYGEYKQKEINLLSGLLSSNVGECVVYDVGAGIGIHTLALSKMAKVVAFEHDQEKLKCLSMKTKGKLAPNVKVIEKNLETTDRNDKDIPSLDGPNTPNTCLLYTSPSPRDRTRSRMPSSA